MMIAVLIDARYPGSSGWVAVRHTRKIRVSGMKEDSLVQIDTNNTHALQTKFDGLMEIPKDASSIKAEIVKIGEGSRISIDLE